MFHPPVSISILLLVLQNFFFPTSFPFPFQERRALRLIYNFLVDRATRSLGEIGRGEAERDFRLIIESDFPLVRNLGQNAFREAFAFLSLSLSLNFLSENLHLL